MRNWGVVTEAEEIIENIRKVRKRHRICLETGHKMPVAVR